MTRRLPMLATGVVVLGVSAAFFLWRQASLRPDMQVKVVAAAPAAPPATPSMPVPPVPEPTPRERARFDRAGFERERGEEIEAALARARRYASPTLAADVADAQARADRGDTEAMLDLGKLLRGCLSAIRDPEARKLREAFEEEKQRAAAAGGHSPGPTRSGSAERDHRDDMDAHRDCTAVGAERIDAYHVWLERAARAGSVEAMRLYAEFALASFETNGELFANLDEVLRRRDLARSFALAAVAAGDAQTLRLVASGHAWQRDDGGRVHMQPLDIDGLFPSDARMAAMYWHADRLVMAGHFGVEREGSFEALWQGLENRASSQLDAAEWQAAVAGAREIYLRHFTGVRGDG